MRKRRNISAWIFLAVGSLLFYIWTAINNIDSWYLLGWLGIVFAITASHIIFFEGDQNAD